MGEGANLGKEVIDDLVLFNRHGIQKDVLQRLDLPCLDEAAKLGDWVPSVLVSVTAAAGATTASATTWCARETIGRDQRQHERTMLNVEKGSNSPRPPRPRSPRSPPREKPPPNPPRPEGDDQRLSENENVTCDGDGNARRCRRKRLHTTTSTSFSSVSHL